jgi:cytoskeleton protein RodZ
VFGLHQNSAKPDQLPPSLPPEKRSPSAPATGSEHASVSQPIAMGASPTEVQPAGLSPASVNDSRSRHAVIKAVELSWLLASCDGKQIFQGLLAANETLAVEFSEEAVLRIGNAGGVEVSLDGKSIGSLGGHGKYRMLKLSPDGKKKEP